MKLPSKAQQRQIGAYLFFGVCTTVVNIVVYWLLAHPCGLGTGLSTIAGWFLSVLFAYITNKLWVFGSKSWEPRLLFREAASFYLCRLLSGLLDLGIMEVTVELLGWNDMLWKFISNVIVVIINYIASRLFIFRK